MEDRLPQRVSFAVAVIAFLSLNLQTITATGRFTGQGAEPAVKPFHIIFAGLLCAVLAGRRLVRWRGEVLLYFTVVLLTGGLASLYFGARPVLANYVFATVALVVGAALGQRLGSAHAVMAFRIGAATVLCAVIIKALLHAHVFIQFFAAPYGHPVLPFFYGGGANLEATWIALAAVFFIGTWLFYPYCLASLSLSVLYASRAAILLLAIIVVADWLRRLADERVAPLRRAMVVIAAVTCSLAGLAATGTLLPQAAGVGYVMQRFASIGDEPGSVSRLALWKAGLQVFQRHPLGVGQGNAMAAVEHELGTSVPEDNLHNTFLQHAVDTGIQGLAAYLLLCIMVAGRLLRDRLRNPLQLFAAIYLAASLIQFRGVDALFWFVYGTEMGVAWLTASGEQYGAEENRAHPELTPSS